MHASLAPTSVPFTYEDYALLPPDGRIWELVEGEFHVNAAPVPFHQTVSRRLQYQLMTLLENTGIAWIFSAPVDLILSEITTLQPDLVIIASKPGHPISDRAIEGRPDLVVEILSKNRSYDQVLKRRVYAKYAVPEYWILDPLGGTLEVLALHGSSYRRTALHQRDGTLSAMVCGQHVAIPLAPIFAPLMLPARKTRPAAQRKARRSAH